MTKITAEAQARQMIADVVETTLPTLRYLRENKLLTVYASPHLGKYPAHAREEAGKGLVYWAIIPRETYMGVGYNTNLISASAVPKSYAELLKNELKGQDRICLQRNRHSHARRDPQSQRRRIRQKTQSPGNQPVSGFRTGDGGSGHVRRSAAVADGLPRSRDRGQDQGSAYSFGRRWMLSRRRMLAGCRCLRSAAYSCGGVVDGFLLSPEVARDPRPSRVRHSVQVRALQTLVSGDRHVDGAIRQSRRAVEK